MVVISRKQLWLFATRVYQQKKNSKNIFSPKESLELFSQSAFHMHERDKLNMAQR